MHASVAAYLAPAAVAAEQLPGKKMLPSANVRYFIEFRNEFDLNFVWLKIVVKFFCLFCVCRATQEASEEQEEEERKGRI